MHGFPWVTTQKDGQGAILEQGCGCGCGLLSWFAPDVPDADRRYGPRPVPVTAQNTAAPAASTWANAPIPAQAVASTPT